MTSENITERRNHLADLKVIRSAVEEAIKQVEKEVEEDAVPEIEPGQVWYNEHLGPMMTCVIETGAIRFVRISNGNTYPTFAFVQPELKYVGESIEVLKVEKNDEIPNRN